MLIYERKAELKWNSANIKRYTQFGYPFTKVGDEFLVEIEHLTPTTRAMVYVLCDFCKKEVMKKSYKNYMLSKKRSVSPHDCCENCRTFKIIEGTQIKYGVDSINQVDSIKKKKTEAYLNNFGVEFLLQSPLIREKIRQTNNEKYGVDNVFQSNDIKEKLRKTNTEKYGSEYYTQTDEYKKRVIETNLDKYGTESPLQSEEIKKRIIETNIIKYGSKSPMQNKEIQAKVRRTLFSNGTAPNSNQQKYINTILNGKLNYPISSISLDIALLDKKIDIEYDGGGHDLSVKLGAISESDFIKKERRREYFLIHSGWKILRIISRSDLLPPIDELHTYIKECIDYLESGRHFIKIDIDNKKIICSQFVRDIEFSKLKQLPRQRREPLTIDDPVIESVM